MGLIYVGILGLVELNQHFFDLLQLPFRGLVVVFRFLFGLMLWHDRIVLGLVFLVFLGCCPQ